MVEKLRFYFSHPIFLSALILSVVLYGRLVPVKSHAPVQSLLTAAQASAVSGFIRGTPSVSRQGGSLFYRCLVSLDELEKTSVNGSPERYSAKGDVEVYIPSSLFEQFYPGRLYSESGQKGFLLDDGAHVQLAVCPRKARDKLCPSLMCTAVLDSSYKNGATGTFFSRRAALRLSFRRLMYSWGKAGALVLSLLSGSREYLDESVVPLFTSAGLSHILALSGMHLSFFSSVSKKIGGCTGGRKNKLILNFAAVTLFLLFAGKSPSLLRAFMGTVVSIAARASFSRKTAPLLVLSFTFLLHASLFPADVFTAAFILSYSAMVGIILFTGPLNSVLVRFIPPRLSSSIATSIAAFLTGAPAGYILFNTIHPQSIVGSVLVSPLVSAFMALSAFFIPVGLTLPFLSGPFGCILNLLYDAILFIVNICARTGGF